VRHLFPLLNLADGLVHGRMETLEGNTTFIKRLKEIRGSSGYFLDPELGRAILTAITSDSHLLLTLEQNAVPTPSNSTPPTLLTSPLTRVVDGMPLGFGHITVVKGPATPDSPSVPHLARSVAGCVHPRCSHTVVTVTAYLLPPLPPTVTPCTSCLPPTPTLPTAAHATGPTQHTLTRSILCLSRSQSVLYYCLTSGV
jgi:hypothetical protein